MPQVARLGDKGSHGGAIITASPNVNADGIALARVGDIYDCPIHGPNPIVTGSATVSANGSKVARLGDLAECGAAIVTASPDVYAG